MTNTHHGFVEFDGTDRVEDYTATFTESGDTVIDFEMAGGETRRAVLSPEQTDVLMDVIQTHCEKNDE